jgi:2-polyprenyl-3-methyl-5-hydroxy-6-metoxy-1,4-benzoquinol methylase
VDELEAVYLAARDRPGGSGFAGRMDRWKRGRSVILAAVDRGGDFLDVGCANGLLMESLTSWSADQGTPLRLHGLEVSEALARRARESLPATADRVYVGDVMTWVPRQRFDFVRTELVYVSPAARSALVLRCLDSLVAEDGRLIVCSYHRTGETYAADLADTLTEWGHLVAGTAQALHGGGSVMTQVAWIDRR